MSSGLRYLLPVSQTADASSIAMPSRIFPWVGIGYPVTTMVVLPGIGALATYLGAHGALLVLPWIQLVALVWGIVHAVRLGAVRHRLARIWRFNDAATPSDEFSPAPTESQIHRDFEERQRPRRGLLPGVQLLTFACLGLTALMLLALGSSAGIAGAPAAITVLDLLLLAVLYTIAIMRNSLDNRFRARIVELRRRMVR